MGLVDSKRIVITGALSSRSIAFRVAELCVTEGAEVVLTSFGRAMQITQRLANRLGETGQVSVMEFDAANESHYRLLCLELSERFDAIDGLVHSIAFAPKECFSGSTLETDFDSVAAAAKISAWSLSALCGALEPLLAGGTNPSVVALDFDSRLAWPGYDWMGPVKAMPAAAVRYAARDLGPAGVRVNLVASGPLSTVASRAIPRFDEIPGEFNRRAPLGWDHRDSTGTAKTVVALLSDWLPVTTGSTVFADGGFSVMGA